MEAVHQHAGPPETGEQQSVFPHPSRSAQVALQLHPPASRSPSSRHPPPLVLPRAAGRHAVRGRENERTDRAAHGENAALKPRDFYLHEARIRIPNAARSEAGGLDTLRKCHTCTTSHHFDERFPLRAALGFAASAALPPPHDQ